MCVTTLEEATVGCSAACNAVHGCCFEIYACVVTVGEATVGCSAEWNAVRSCYFEIRGSNCRLQRCVCGKEKIEISKESREKDYRFQCKSTEK